MNDLIAVLVAALAYVMFMLGYIEELNDGNAAPLAMAARILALLFFPLLVCFAVGKKLARFLYA